MAFYKHILVVTLISALALSSSDVSQAACHLLDTPTVPTADLVLSVIPSNLPMLRTQQPFLIQPKTTFSMFHLLPEVSTQPALTNSLFPILSSTQTPSQLTLSTLTLPLLPSTHIPSMPTEPTLPNSTLTLDQAQLLANSTLPNMPTDPKVKLPAPAATQLPTIPTRQIYSTAIPSNRDLQPSKSGWSDSMDYKPLFANLFRTRLQMSKKNHSSANPARTKEETSKKKLFANPFRTRSK